LCCNIFDKDEIVIKGRYSDYPWWIKNKDNFLL
jgi:hypothetical protein